MCQQSTHTKRNMDTVFQAISKAINIDADRKQYTEMYNFVRKSVIDDLKADYPHFKTLLWKLQLCGSYADNLKITKPNEFDEVMRLKFPSNELVEISRDNNNRGNVIINLSNVLQHLELTKQESMHEFLKKMVNEKKFFLQDKFQRWLEGCFTKWLIKIDKTLTYLGERLKLCYRKQGPAHTIDVMNDKYQLSIDFVPGFVFESKKSIYKRSLNSQFWEAIPKPLYCDTYIIHNNPSFRTSYTESERKLISSKKQLKNTLRIMKKFRDMNPKMGELKSYFIKTLFLWQTDEESYSFWNRTTTDIMHVMFEKLETALKDQRILFFWDKKLNLLNKLSSFQIDSMYHQVKRARKKLLTSNEQDVLDLFLTKEEQNCMSVEDQNAIAENSISTEPKEELSEDEYAINDSYFRIKPNKVQSYMPQEEQSFQREEEQAEENCQSLKPIIVVGGLMAAVAIASFAFFRNQRD